MELTSCALGTGVKSCALPISVLGLLVAEIVQQVRLRQARFDGDLVEPGAAEAAPGEDLFGGAQDAAAVALADPAAAARNRCPGRLGLGRNEEIGRAHV